MVFSDFSTLTTACKYLQDYTFGSLLFIRDVYKVEFIFLPYTTLSSEPAPIWTTLH